MNNLLVKGYIPAPEFEELTEYRNLYLDSLKTVSGTGHVSLDDARECRGKSQGHTIKITRTKEGDFVLETVETF